MMAEMTAQKRTMESLTKHIDTEAHVEQKILELREEAKKQQQWYEDQLANRSKLVKEAEQILKDEIHHLEDIHSREATL